MATDYEKLIAKAQRLEEREHNLKLELGQAKRRNAKLVREVDMLESKLILERAALTPENSTLPDWTTRPATSSKSHHAWDVQMISDLHLGETQLASEVGGYNSFNDKIAAMRLEHLTTSSLKISQEFTSGITFDGACLPFAGDVITGEIHEELVKTNSESVPETIVINVPRIAAIIKAFKENYKYVLVPWAEGNHDRRGRVMETKNSARDSYSWIIAHWVADYFKNDPNVVFYIPNARDVRFDLYDTKFLMNHGYGMKSSGIGGATAAVMAERQLYSVRENVIGRSFDWYLCGHLHQTVFAQGGIMCGCLKGYDTYASTIKCKPEPPSQAKFFVTPERGVTMRMPIYCEAPGERKFWQ